MDYVNMTRKPCTVYMAHIGMLKSTHIQLLLINTLHLYYAGHERK